MNVLFLCCCSNGKLAGGERDHRPEGSIPLSIPERCHKLLEARRQVFQRIDDGAGSAHGKPLRDLPYNGQLVLGRDLGGERTGAYMPASARYHGRFWRELDPGGSDRLGASPHHWIIVSALYGLLTSNEPIQRYSCHTLDDEGITEVWTRGGLLTSLLLEYVRVFNVKLVVDLMADVTYHNLFNWERVSRKVRVLQAFGAQNAGPGLLPALGFLVRDRLLNIPTEELFGIRTSATYHTDYEDIVLTPEPAPPEGFLGRELPKDKVRPRGDDEPSPPMSTQAEDGPKGECVVLPQSREIPVSSKDHKTIFGRPINSIRDFPPEARRLLAKVSRAAEVLYITVDEMTQKKGASKEYELRLSSGRQRDGVIAGKLVGPSKLKVTQQIRIRVTPGREETTRLAIERLLAGEME